MLISRRSLRTHCDIDQFLGRIQFLPEKRIPKLLVSDQVDGFPQNAFQCFLEAHELLKRSFEAIPLKGHKEVDVVALLQVL